MALTHMYVTVAGAGTKAGTSWANAFGLTEWITDMASSSAGDVYWVEGGTYTLTGNINTIRDGSYFNAISIVGVNSGTTNEPPVYSDYATGANRPLIAAGAYTTTWDNDWFLQNLRFTTTTSGGVDLGFLGFMRNVSIDHGSGTPGRYCLTQDISRPGPVFDCEFSGTFNVTDGIKYSGPVINCFFHDLERAIDNASTVFGLIVVHCIFTKCNQGIYSTNMGAIFFNNTFNGCKESLETNANGIIAINNAFSNYYRAAYNSRTDDSNYLDYNNYYAPAVTGTHTGSDNASVLTDSAADFLSDGALGRVITNTTDGSSGTITAVTSTTVTATLTGGTDNDWDTGDEYSIAAGTDVTAFTKGSNATANNPLFTDYKNEDLSLQSSSTLIDAGVGISKGVG